MNARHASIRSLVSLTLFGVLLAGGQTALGGPAKAPHAVWEGPADGAHAAASLSSTPLRPLAIPAPPKGFNALTATDAQLRIYGFPPRPNARTDPKRYATWVDLIHHMKHRVTAVLKPRPGVRFNTTSGNWAGSVILSPRPSCSLRYGCSSVMTGTYNAEEVDGQWTVPDVSGSTQDGDASVWVGFDGAAGSGNTQVEQAGTDSDVVNGTPQYYAWIELFPDPPVTISDLTVSPGDRMVVEVNCAVSGVVSFTVDDYTSGYYTPSYLQATYGCPGASSEFIVERPCTDATCTDHLPLADFGYVYMHDLSATLTNPYTGATTTVGGTYNSFNTSQLDMNDGNLLAQTDAWSWMNNGMTVFWKGYQ